MLAREDRSIGIYQLCYGGTVSLFDRVQTGRRREMRVRAARPRLPRGRVVSRRATRGRGVAMTTW